MVTSTREPTTAVDVGAYGRGTCFVTRLTVGETAA